MPLLLLARRLELTVDMAMLAVCTLCPLQYVDLCRGILHLLGRLPITVALAASLLSVRLMCSVLVHPVEPTVAVVEHFCDDRLLEVAELEFFI